MDRLYKPMIDQMNKNSEFLSRLRVELFEYADVNSLNLTQEEHELFKEILWGMSEKQGNFYKEYDIQIWNH